MKNQYFGDARDYFKYDVVDRLASDLAGIQRLTCVWMLTPPDASGQGTVKFRPDPELEDLSRFFQVRLDPRDQARCRVAEMAVFFAARPFRFLSYRDERDDFTASTRANYFSQIPDDALEDAVVFFDPDTGMEPTHCKPAHLRFGELGQVMDRMGTDSVAVVFQYQRRTAGWVESIAAQLAEGVSPHVGWILETPLAFYVIAKSAERLADAIPILANVARRHTPGGALKRQVGTRYGTRETGAE